jgi:para-nitrobenzyl esterase
MNRREFFANSGIAGGLCLSGSAWATETPGMTVETVTGKLRGLSQGKVTAFRGIPYGASTDGARFLPAGKPMAWAGVREAYELGPSSPQSPSSLIPEAMAIQPKHDYSGTEDCLRLNVWTPGNRGKRPVMVWFHGGGFSAGSASWPIYYGANLAAKHDVVVVTVNHRLNVFGYLHLLDVGGARYAQSANVGMLDTIQSLEWVRDNIERFGGDPANVTIFGQSGGGGKVSTLLGMPAAKGLFHKAIAQSGSLVRGISRDQASKAVRDLMAKANVKTADELGALPLATLVAAMRATPGLTLNPIMDGRTLPAHPFDPATTISESVPLMIGSTETEVTWSTATNYDAPDDAGLRARVKEAVRGTTDTQADQLIAVYRKQRPKASNLDLALMIATDVSNFRTGTDTIAERKAGLGKAPVYKYYFQWYSPVREGKPRSFHTLEIPFHFQNLDVAAPMTGTGPERQALADKMSATWTSFARSGNPNNKAIPKWDPFNTDSRALMIFNNECRSGNDPFQAERLALASVSQPRG